jgi:membrane protein DedA with SNARE-associated domain
MQPLLADFGIPVPGEALLIPAAIFAGSGHMRIAVARPCGNVAR